MRQIDPDGRWHRLTVREYAAGLSAEDFKQVLWPTEEGDRVVYAYPVRTWVRKLGPRRVLIVKTRTTGQVRYRVTGRLEDTPEQVVGHAAQRWD